METVHNNHNVFLVGAGFSKDRGMPLVSGFLNCMRDSLDLVENERERDAITSVLEFRREAAGASDRIHFDVENIEELFSLAAMAGDVATLDSIPLAISATLDQLHRTAVATRIVIEPTDVAVFPHAWNEEYGEVYDQRKRLKVPAYEVYLATVQELLGNATPDSKNTFISFNYDLVLEEAAKNLGLKVWYGLSPETTHTEEAKRLWASGRDGAVALLKLHGSTNWGRQDKSPNYVVCGDYEELLNARLRPALVPPTWKKVFSSPLEEVWRNAVATLSTATRLAIVGYSMSPTDSHFRYLLAAGLKDNVSLRRIEFVTWGPQPEPEGDDYEDLVLERAKGLVREQLWERGDVHYTYTGTRGFFMQHVNGPDWNRAWGQGLSHFA